MLDLLSGPPHNEVGVLVVPVAMGLATFLVFLRVGLSILSVVDLVDTERDGDELRGFGEERGVMD